MDAYGNLTSQDEFSGGRRIRLISYLGPDIALGVTAADITGPLGIPMVEATVGVHHLSTGDPARTVLIANAVSGGFSLAPGEAPDTFLIAGDTVGVAAPNSLAIQAGGPPVFTVQFVDGCWFTLGPQGEGDVFDIPASVTTEGTNVLCFPLNGGQNQTWRAEVVPAQVAETIVRRPVTATEPVQPVQSGLWSRVKIFLRRLLGRT
jgi:hypothetical protein